MSFFFMRMSHQAVSRLDLIEVTDLVMLLRLC
jgi:hypothetical protein